MNIYLVGGAVRDKLLGLPVKERDWVVVGATPQEMLAQGFKPVGKDFPVFLHPVTHEEYALARTERKTGPGYKGFAFYAAPDVTLEQDLQRRDLTINAMAQTPDGNIIDPYQGRQDLEARLLRHVSDAFVEDPVRILRVARFAARFGHFELHPDTLDLMQKMTHSGSGEIDALVPERVWQEWEKALQEKYPVRFFEILSQCHALQVLFPELVHHNAGLNALQRATEYGFSAEVRFAALMYGLVADDMRLLAKRYKIPNSYSKLALTVSKLYPHYEQTNKNFPQAEICLNVLEALDAFRRPSQLDRFLSVCEAVAGKKESKKKSDLWHASCQAAKSANVRDLVSQNLPGDAIRTILRERQMKAINVALLAMRA